MFTTKDITCPWMACDECFHLVPWSLPPDGDRTTEDLFHDHASLRWRGTLASFQRPFAGRCHCLYG